MFWSHPSNGRRLESNHEASEWSLILFRKNISSQTSSKKSTPEPKRFSEVDTTAVNVKWVSETLQTRRSGVVSQVANLPLIAAGNKQLSDVWLVTRPRPSTYSEIEKKVWYYVDEINSCQVDVTLKKNTDCWSLLYMLQFPKPWKPQMVKIK